MDHVEEKSSGLEGKREKLDYSVTVNDKLRVYMHIYIYVYIYKLFTQIS